MAPTCFISRRPPSPRSRAEIDRLITDMVETMYAAPGIGLAAPQVGVPLRIFVIDISIGRDPKGLITMINPEFVERDGMQLEEEGCLSVPGFNATVVRPLRAVVKGLDRDGHPQQIEGRRAPGARLPARNGSPRRHAVRRSAARHQERDRSSARSGSSRRPASGELARAEGRLLRHTAVRGARRSTRSSPLRMRSWAS